MLTSLLVEVPYFGALFTAAPDDSGVEGRNIPESFSVSLHREDRFGFIALLWRDLNDM
jgi:hypothetical protein